MYIQIVNTKLPKFNTVQATPATIISQLNKLGWNKADCKFKQIRNELVDIVYRGVDGKNIPNGRKQYLGRARSNKTHNMKVNYVSKTQALAMVE